MSEIKAALQRKLGPLPAWAWALIAGAAIYVYRTRQAIGGPAAAANLDASSPEVTDASGGADPITLSPGESVYDPNSGQLIGTAPEQQPNEPQDPVTLEPGETVYDPNSGDLIDPTGGKATGKKGKKKPKAKGDHKRKPKAKPHHKHPNPVKKPGHHKSKPRGAGKVMRNAGRLIAKKTGGHGHVPTKARVRGKAAAHPSGPSRTRARAASAPAQRQRPAAPKITHPATQKVAPHPAKPPAAAHHPAPAPAPHKAARKRR